MEFFRKRAAKSVISVFRIRNLLLYLIFIRFLKRKLQGKNTSFTKLFLANTVFILLFTN
jgi:hypothetical protein